MTDGSLPHYPYFRATELLLYAYGIIFTIFSVITGIISLKVYEIENKLGVYWSLMIMPIFLIIALIGSGLVFMWYGFIFFLFRESVRGFVFPIL